MSNIIDSFLNKVNLRKEIRKHILSHSPALLSKLNSKVIEDVGLYLKGYNACLKGLTKQPVNEYEVKDLLLKEGVKFTLDLISDGKG